MNWLFNLIDFLQRETWWRKRYKRINFTKDTPHTAEKCNFCNAEMECNIIKNKDCPCKDNQYLKRK